MSSHINCHCKGCNYKICTTLNSWIAVSTTLFTYEDSKQYFEHHLETIQQLRDGSPQSELEGCVVKLTRCKICRVGLGVRCVETPEDKVHFRDRVFYRLPQLNLYDSLRDQMVLAMIKNTNPPSGSLILSNFAANSPHAPARIPSVDETNATTRRLLDEQRNDIDRILLLMNELKREVNSMKDTIADMKRSEPRENNAGRRASAFPEEMEILTENVARLNGRVGDIDGLRLEMIVMKRRVKVLEQGLPTTQSSHTVTGLTPPTYPRPISSEPRMSALASRPAPLVSLDAQRPRANGEGQSPVVASSIESRTQSTGLYGVSPQYQNGDKAVNGDHEMRDRDSPLSDVSSSSNPSSLSSSPSLEIRSLPPRKDTPQHADTTSQSLQPAPPKPAYAVPGRLNNITMIQTSDPEDSDYNPNSQSQPQTQQQATRGEKVRLATPEWERPSWIGPPKTSPPKSSILRQDTLGAPEPDPKRRKTSSFAEG